MRYRAGLVLPTLVIVCLAFISCTKESTTVPSPLRNAAPLAVADLVITETTPLVTTLVWTRPGPEADTGLVFWIHVAADTGGFALHGKTLPHRGAVGDSLRYFLDRLEQEQAYRVFVTGQYLDAEPESAASDTLGFVVPIR